LSAKVGVETEPFRAKLFGVRLGQSNVFSTGFGANILEFPEPKRALVTGVEDSLKTVDDWEGLPDPKKLVAGFCTNKSELFDPKVAVI
jgi:hypothetical protein